MDNTPKEDIQQKIIVLLKKHKYLNLHQISDLINEKKLNVLRAINNLCKRKIINPNPGSWKNSFSVYYKIG